MTKKWVCIYEISDHLPKFVIAKNTKCCCVNKKKFKRSKQHFFLEDFLTDLDNKLSTYNIKLSDQKNVNQDMMKLTSIFKSTLDKNAPMHPLSRKKRLS